MESTLYQQVATITPNTEEGWEKNLANIGFVTIQIDDMVYDRVWGDQADEKVDFVVFNETVVLPNEKKR